MHTKIYCHSEPLVVPNYHYLAQPPSLQQLDAALAAAKEVGGASVPLLPPERCEAYVRAVCSAEGLTALAAAVVRNASSTLKVRILRVCGVGYGDEFFYWAGGSTP